MKRIRNTTILCLAILTIGSMESYAQNRPLKRNEVLEDANISFEIGDYRSAIQGYAELLASDSLNAEYHYRLGVSYFYLKKPHEAKPHLEKSVDKDHIEALYYLAQVNHMEGNIEEGIQLFQEYKNSPGHENIHPEEVRRLIDQLRFAEQRMKAPVNVSIENIGTPINTPYHEYVPLVYGDENEIFFTSRRPGSTGGLKDPTGLEFEDVYVSQKEHGYWAEPKQLNENVNTSTHDACAGLSPDGQILFVFRTNEDLRGGNLYRSDLDENGWGQIKSLPSDINSENIESSISISSDEKIMYFSSDREGGYGGKDIYRCVKLPTGAWSLAQNLGPTINTPFDEDAPFIHADGKTLYFSSKGHNNMGGYDIFQSELQEDGLWSVTENVGYPINTVTDDIYFVLSSDKQSGYYSSSQKGGYGGQDIYIINFKLDAQILSVVKGGIFAGDSLSTMPIGARITLINKQTNVVQGIYQSKVATGKFIMLLTPEQEYTMIVEAEGFHPYSQDISIDATGGFSRKMDEIHLVPLQTVSND